MTICHFTVVCLLYSLTCFGQHAHSYLPIQLEGNPPKEFIEVGVNPAEILFKISNAKKQKEELSFRTVSTYNLRQLFLSGNIYYNDICSRYVNKVVNNIVQAADIRKPFRVFISRFHQPNATAWNDGTIIVNIGLLALLENEDQLAFVLAHEMAHVVRDHPYQQYVNNQKLREIQKRALDSRKSFISYSLKNEYEADRIAIEYLKNSKYSLKEAAKVFDLLVFKDKEFNSNLPEHLSSSKVKLSSSNACKKGDYTTLMEAYNTGEDEMTKSLVQRKQRFEQYRIRNTKKTKTKVEQSEFERIKQISQFELVENTYISSDHIRSICYSLKLLHEFPKNEYLKAKLVENLYYLGYYHKEQELEDIFFDAGSIYDPDLAGIYCLLNQFAVDRLEDLVFGYVENQYSKLNENENILITLAKINDLYKGRQSSLPYYKKYIEQYPKGNHVIFARSKIESQ